MQRLWFITNIHSGNATAEKCRAIKAVFEERGLTLAGRTDFPEEALPDPEALAATAIDTLVLFGGDGTINVALCRYANWSGAILILPGGTMNLLATALHDTPTSTPSFTPRTWRRFALPCPVSRPDHIARSSG